MVQGIEGKVILITGGSTGIGAETARLLAGRGAQVAVAARRKDKLETIVAGIAAQGGTARAYGLDVTDKAQMDSVVAAVVSDFGRQDVLINNAGMMPIRPMAEANTDEWDAMIDVNLKGTLYGIRASGPIMLLGNGFLLKHAPNVMRSAYALQQAHEAAGFPPGLFANLSADNETVARVIADPRIAAVTLTGSMGAGAVVAATAARVLKKSLLELGGSAAFIVLADANIDLAVQAGIQARFQNTGQVCLAAKRFILERPIAEEFTRKFVQATRALKVADPSDPATQVGPMARKDLRAELHGQVQRTLAQGATLLLGGHEVEGPGNFYAPTVLAGVAPGMAAFDEETFGPVAAITIADDVEHAIELANTSEYGLGANLWTTDVAQAQRIARRLETGGVFINGFSASNARIPVGGVKKSGYGRELSHIGLREFTNAQAVWTKTVA